MAQYQPDVMATLRTDPPVTLTYDKLKEWLTCIFCKTVKSSGMVLLKCMHFVCDSNDGFLESTCLATFHCAGGGFMCRICEIQTYPEDISMRRFYTQEVVKFYQILSEIWSGGSDTKLRCEKCYKLYDRETLSYEWLQPCRTCDPAPLYCLGAPRYCFGKHQLESHQQDTVGDVSFGFLEWEAMNNAVKVFPEFHPSPAPQQPPQQRHQLHHRPPSRGAHGAPTIVTAGRQSGVYTASCPGVHLPVKQTAFQSSDPCWIPVNTPITIEGKALLAVVSCELITLLQLYNKLFGETLNLSSELQFAGIDKLRVAYTNAIYHNQILHILISRYSGNYKTWKVMQPEFSSLSIFKMCRNIFPISVKVERKTFIGQTKQYEKYSVIPAITQPPVHVFNGDIKGILTASGALPSQPSPTVEISICKLELGPAGYQDTKPTTRRCVYKEENYPDELLTPYIRRVNIGKHVYAYTTANSVNIAMTDEDGMVLKKWEISNGESFGTGLWWDGSRLFALLVNTKIVSYWTFEQKSAFLRRYVISPNGVNLDFAANDSLAVQEDKLIVCYHPVRPSQDGMALQNFIHCLSLDPEITPPENVRLMFNNPPAIKHPLLLGFQQLPHILILDRTPPGNSLVYRAPDESWNKLKLSFDDLHPVHVTDAWLEDETFLRVLCTTTAAQPEAEMAEEGYAGAAAALPPPAQQLPIKQIQINLWLTN